MWPSSVRAYSTRGGCFCVAYGQNSYVGKILEIHQEQPGRIHVVLIRRAIGY